MALTVAYRKLGFQNSTKTLVHHMDLLIPPLSQISFPKKKWLGSPSLTDWRKSAKMFYEHITHVFKCTFVCFTDCTSKGSMGWYIAINWFNWPVNQLGKIGEVFDERLRSLFKFAYICGGYFTSKASRGCYISINWLSWLNWSIN